MDISVSDDVKSRESLNWLRDTVKVLDIVAGLLIGFTIATSDICVSKDVSPIVPGISNSVAVSDTIKSEENVLFAMPELRITSSDKVMTKDNIVSNSFLVPGGGIVNGGIVYVPVLRRRIGLGNGLGIG